MRKTLLLLVCALALLFSPALTYGDAGGPMIREKDCAVTNPDGAPYYVWNGDTFAPASDVIPYGTILSVTGEYYKPDFMGSGTSGRVGTARYGDNYVYIDLQYFAIVDNTDPLQEAYPFPEKVSRKVIAGDGVLMYAGPSPVYEVIDKVPYGESITFTYGDAYDDFSACSFAYGEWGGSKGWFMVYDMGDTPTFAQRVDGDSPYLGVVSIVDEGVCLVDINQYDADTQNYAAVSDPLPVGMVISFDYYFAGWQGTFAQVNYLGKEGFLPIARNNWIYPGGYTDVYTGVLVYNRDQYIVSRTEAMLYKTPGDRNSALDIVVPANSILGVEATYLENIYDDNLRNAWNLVSYQGQQGYLLREKMNAYNQETFSDILYDTECYADFTVYAQPDMNSEVIAECQTAEDIYILYYVFDTDSQMPCSFVVGPDFAGWVYDGIYSNNPVGPGAVALLASVLGVEPMEAEEPPEADISPEEEAAPEETAPVATETRDEPNELVIPGEDSGMERSAKEMKDTIILAACAAVIGAVTATAIIFLLKKKKKSSQ